MRNGTPADCSLWYSAASSSRVGLSEMSVDHAPARLERQDLLRQLRELIGALDARVPHLERTGETRIADDAKALRTKAFKRIADLDGKR